MFYRKISDQWVVLAVTFAALFVGCEKEEEITGPAGPGSKPTNAVVSVDKSIILSAGRDSSKWHVQLVRDSEDFPSMYTVNLLTDRHGYFLKNGKMESNISFQTDKNGEADICFYGSREPGISRTLLWGEGFGLDTVTVSVILGFPYYLHIDLADPVEQVWKDTDTLTSGVHFSRPDSTLVRATVLDIKKNPLEGIFVNFNNGSPPLPGGVYGYFRSVAPSGKGKSTGYGITDVSGIATDIYYSDLVPVVGDPVNVQIFAEIDSARFGIISSWRFIAIVPP